MVVRYASSAVAKSVSGEMRESGREEEGVRGSDTTSGLGLSLSPAARSGGRYGGNMNREYINGTKPSIKLCTAITSFLSYSAQWNCLTTFNHHRRACS